MRRTPFVVLAAFVGLALFLPALAFAHSDTHGFVYGDDDDFTWAVITDGNTSMSGSLDQDMMEVLKDRFGDRFLYFGDDDDQWVVTDRDLIERAQRASREVGRYGREIGELARTSVREAFRGSDLSAEEKKDLERRRQRASAKLREAVRQVKEEMHDILHDAKSRHRAELVG